MKTTTIIAGEREWTVTLTPARGRGFVVAFPEIPNLITEGSALAEAKAKATDCVHGYLVSLAGDPAALAALEAARQRSRIERELREARDGEPSIPLAVAEQWMDLWDADDEQLQPEPQ